VRFFKVKDVNKLSKALNDVSYGHFRVRGKLARIDRNDSKDVKGGVEDKGEGLDGSYAVENEGEKILVKGKHKEVLHETSSNPNTIFNNKSIDKYKVEGPTPSKIQNRITHFHNHRTS
jgi:hypothetical protein